MFPHHSTRGSSLFVDYEVRGRGRNVRKVFPKDGKWLILSLTIVLLIRDVIEDNMDIKETDMHMSTDDVMLQNSEYYKYIFKKTEKIVCAVFFILRNDAHEFENDIVLKDLEDASKTLLDTALASLNTSQASLDSVARQLRFDLVSLESQLRIAHAARHLTTQFLEVFLREITSLQRTLRSYTERSANPLERAEVEQVRVRSTKPSRTVAMPALQVSATQGGQRSRRERIIEVLKDKGPATIKDITDVVTDCSEKTIQRELIALIKDNMVHREGERRWSKYSLA